MNVLRIFLFAGLLLTGFFCQAQPDPELDGQLIEETMSEAVLTDEGTETLLLDNTRSKIGRDFYDAFFRRYAELPKAISPLMPADTTQKIGPNVELDVNAFIVTIDETPAFGVGTTIISVTLNDQVIWQNYVQFRAEVIELYAFNAAEVANQYVLNYQDVQRSLESEDQRGSGIF
ncbi:CsgE family curli-type amyloid fiber assembly protein [Spirosoma montaniterrae]|uniref:Curli production assembly/transport component CsgE n=1 Tax=Spirosoma montaniterrae TaxID=1178516 RepID=A0A1P9WZS4_9BACT|nr:CsgE family curli-type amyloid fiber assembly protein [Spirosoma montaniterrae]AQG80864.1 hypothetical protein AWR27_16980 [Spirosoma montaniterrae]